VNRSGDRRAGEIAGERVGCPTATGPGSAAEITTVAARIEIAIENRTSC
jgi:hypothetical protein